MKKIITFDFDGTLCKEDGTPNLYMIELMFKYSEEGCKIYIVSSRNKSHELKRWIKKNQPERIRIKDFIKEHNLPVKQCHFTNHILKGETLYKIGSHLHYDNDPEEIKSANDFGIRAILPV